MEVGYSLLRIGNGNIQIHRFLRNHLHMQQLLMLFTEVSEDSSIERNLEYTNNPHWSVADADVRVVQIGPSSVCALYPFTQSLIQAKAYLPFSPKLKLSASFATSSIVGWNSAFASAGSLSKAFF